MDSVQFELKSQMKPRRPFRLIANPCEKGYEMKCFRASSDCLLNPKALLMPIKMKSSEQQALLFMGCQVNFHIAALSSLSLLAKG